VSERVANERKIDVKLLNQKGHSDSISKAKALFVFIGVEFSGKTTREMAREVKMSESVATRARLRGAALLGNRNLERLLKVN